MAAFINRQFVNAVLTEDGRKGLLDEQQIEEIRLLVELEARLVLESSIKFMNKDRRDVVESQDVCLSAVENGHKGLVLCKESFGPQACEEEVTSDIMEKELQFLCSAQVSKPQLSARWIYVSGKVPNLNGNASIRCLTKQLQQRAEEEEKRKLVSIIKDDPYALLTQQQRQYFQCMCEAMDDNIRPDGKFTLQGDLNNMLPFFLKFMGEKPLNETGVCFLLKLIDNKYIWECIEYYLKKILNLLLAYRGTYSFEVGERIASLVDRFCCKYPLLRDIFENYQDDSYSTVLKKIPFEMRLGIPLRISEEFITQCRKDSDRYDPMASLCLQTLLTFSSQLKHFKQFLLSRMDTYIYWHPCLELRSDPYLRMF